MATYRGVTKDKFDERIIKLRRFDRLKVKGRVCDVKYIRQSAGTGQPLCRMVKEDYFGKGGFYSYSNQIFLRP
jgi:hypothetical protein